MIKFSDRQLNVVLRDFEKFEKLGRTLNQIPQIDYHYLALAIAAIGAFVLLLLVN